jgi:hypothetical protein
MVRRALTQVAKLSADFPGPPEALPPSVMYRIHSKASITTALRSVHSLNLSF